MLRIAAQTLPLGTSIGFTMEMFAIMFPTSDVSFPHGVSKTSILKNPAP
jgi:hypothetical protein